MIDKLRKKCLWKQLVIEVSLSITQLISFESIFSAAGNTFF